MEDNALKSTGVQEGLLVFTDSGSYEWKVKVKVSLSTSFRHIGVEVQIHSFLTSPGNGGP